MYGPEQLDNQFEAWPRRLAPPSKNPWNKKNEKTPEQTKSLLISSGFWYRYLKKHACYFRCLIPPKNLLGSCPSLKLDEVACGEPRTEVKRSPGGCYYPNSNRALPMNLKFLWHHNDGIRFQRSNWCCGSAKPSCEIANLLSILPPGTGDLCQSKVFQLVSKPWPKGFGPDAPCGGRNHKMHGWHSTQVGAKVQVLSRLSTVIQGLHTQKWCLESND